MQDSRRCALSARKPTNEKGPTMARSELPGVNVAGIASVVPSVIHRIEDDRDLLCGGDAEMRRIKKVIGLGTRHVVPPGRCASDLAEHAFQRLLPEVGWAAESIDALVFVTQCPDYIMPSTACVLHGKLGLSKDCAAFDVNQGCAGYVYGLWLGAMMIASHACRRVAILTSDTVSRLASPSDRSTTILFGDAGAATLLESSDVDDSMYFSMHCDGTGFDQLFVPAGGFRTPRSHSTGTLQEHSAGCARSDEHLYMNGAEIMDFTLREVPPLLKGIVDYSGWAMEDVDGFVLHQANRFIIRNIARKAGLPLAKCPDGICEKFGNQSCASVPVTMCHCLGSQLRNAPTRLVMAGFGAGLSWAACAATVGPMACLPIIEE